MRSLYRSLRELYLGDPHYAPIDFGFRRGSQSHKFARMFAAYGNYMSSVNSFKRIYFGRGPCTDPNENYISRTHIIQLSFLVGQGVKCSTKFLRVTDPRENIKAYDNYMLGDNIFKGSTLSKVLVMTLTRTTSRGPVPINLILSYACTLDSDRESFLQGLQSDYQSNITS